MKWVLIFFIFFFRNSESGAQDHIALSFKRFAFQIGVNTGNMNFNMGSPAPAVHEESSWKNGLTIGLLVRIPLADRLFLQPEYAYTQRRGTDRSSGMDYFMDYCSLPVLLNYDISSRFALLAGPQAELLISARSTSNGFSNDITHDVEERSIGLVAGFEVQVNKSFFLSARYLQGLNHIGIGQRSENTKEFKYEVISVTAGVRF